MERKPIELPLSTRQTQEGKIAGEVTAGDQAGYRHPREWSLKIEEFIWLEDIVDKLERKHNVQVHEVVETLSSRPLFRFLEKGHRPGEHLYLGLGQTDAGRYLAVFFIFKPKNTALVVSGRDMKTSERRQYGQRTR